MLGLCLASIGCIGRGDDDRSAAPTLQLRFDREAGLLEGRWPDIASESSPALLVDLEGQAGQRLAIDADGRFRGRFAPGQLLGGRAITLSLASASSPEGFVFHRVVPQVRVSLHPGDIVGTMAPSSTIAIRLVEGGHELGTGTGWSNESGRFSAWVYDAEGRRQRPRPGQKIRIDDGQSPIEFEIPPLEGAWSLETQRLGGRGLAGADIDLTMWNPWRPGETETPSTQVDAAGGWRIASQHGLHPATHFYITQHLPSGDQLYLCQQIPMLYVEPGSALVEVQTLWETRGRLELEREGSVIASAEGGGPWSGNLQLVLRDERGEPIAALAGDLLRARLQDPARGARQQQEYRLRVESLESQYDAAAGEVLISAPRWAEPVLAEPERPLVEPAAIAAGTGAWRFNLGQRLGPGGMPAPGQRFEIHYPLAEGHNIRQRFIGPSLSAEVGGRALTGRASPGAALQFSRRTVKGETGRFEARATISGSFRLELPPDQPDISVGDRLHLEAASEAVELEVWGLDATWEADGRSLWGSAPPDARIEIEAWMHVADPPLRFQTMADEAGRWRMNLVDRGSGLAGLDLARVQRLEVAWIEGARGLRQVVRDRPRP